MHVAVPCLSVEGAVLQPVHLAGYTEIERMSSFCHRIKTRKQDGLKLKPRRTVLEICIIQFLTLKMFLQCFYKLLSTLSKMGVSACHLLDGRHANKSFDFSLRTPVYLYNTQRHICRNTGANLTGLLTKCCTSNN